MTLSNHHLRLTFVLGLAIIIVLLNMFPIVPTLVDQGRDGGVYAYVSQVIYDDGGKPYRDAWDNKAPGTFYIGALGMALVGVNRWAIWVIELIFVSLTAMAFTLLLVDKYVKSSEQGVSVLRPYRIYSPWRVVVVGTILFAMMARHADLIAHGNMTQSFAILPQVLFLWLGYRFMKKPSLWLGFLLGFIASAAFLTRQNAIGMALTFVPILLFTGILSLRSRQSWAYVGMMILGGLTGLGLAALALYDVLPETYRTIVISPSALHHWQQQETIYPWVAFLRTISDDTAIGVFWQWIPMIGFGLYWILRRQREPLYLWAAATFGLDLIMANLTGQAYNHYFITLVPSTLLVMTIAYAHLNSLPRRTVFMAWIYISILIFGMGLTQFRKFERGEGTFAFNNNTVEHPLSTYVRDNTHPDDKVLVWGISSFINFQSRRDSPTQFHYSYALIIPDYTTNEDIQDFLDDMNRNQPVMIVDRTLDGEASQRVPPLGLEDRQKWLEEGGRGDTKDLSAIFDYVAEHCTRIDELHGAAIYTCIY